MTDWLPDWFYQLHAWLFETLVAPGLYELGLAVWLEPAMDATEACLLGLLEILVAMAVMMPLERLIPVERHQPGDRPAVRTDIWYTLLQRAGLIPLILFLAFLPLQNEVEETMRDYGLTPIQLDQLLPGLADWPLATFVAYLLILDLAEYLRHRAQHALRWWWALHALHHDQRRMTFWSDDRNHFLDSALQYVWFVTIALVIGVPPAQFLLLAITGRLIESLSHANARLHFGWLGERLIVSPRFHRRHHAVLESGAGRGVNFAVLFPIWDILFGSADFSRDFPATGITEPPFRPGVLAQQWDGVRRMTAALTGHPAAPAPGGKPV
jgi:sterol desaturase/sphingolipid hydroxylase (fatty acid hydroxylase superfamily)